MKTSKINTIIIQNRQLTGTTYELALQLRDEYRLTEQQIGDLLGVTKSCISYHLIKAGRRGPLKIDRYEFLTKDLFEQKTDEELSVIFDLPMVTVARVRRLRCVNRRQIISLSRRRANLCYKLFKAKPGINFKKFLEQLKFETKVQNDNFTNFYLLGKKDNPCLRAYRSKITDILKVDIDKNQLIKEGIIANDED